MLSTSLSFVVLLMGLMLIHKWSPFFGSVLCSAFAYYGVRRLLQHKLDVTFSNLSQNTRLGTQTDTFILSWTSSIGCLLQRVLHGRREVVRSYSADGVGTRVQLASPNGKQPGARCDPHCSLDSAHVVEVKTFVGNIRALYIEPWYALVSSDTDFPKELEFIIEDVLLAVCEKLFSVDPCKLTKQTIMVFHEHYRNYTNALRAAGYARQSDPTQIATGCREEDIVNNFVFSHWALENETYERCYLQAVTSILVGLVQPPNVLSSPATNALVIDILTNNILVAAVNLLSDPKWVNSAVVYLCSCEDDPDILSLTEHTLTAEETNDLVSPCDTSLPKDQACNADADLALPIVLPKYDPDPVAVSFILTLSSQEASGPENSNLAIPRKADISAREQQRLPNVYFNAEESSAQVWSYGDVEQAVEAEEFLGSLTFSDIHIVRTESRSAPGKGVHTVYCIEYETSEAKEGQCVICKVHETWRRFREFMELQSSLEKNPTLAQHLKGIRGPSRWLGTLSDKKNVMERRIFLEQYLRNLCARRVIASSAEFHKFLDFNVDKDVPHVSKATATSTRFNKVLAQGVRDALDLFRRIPVEDHGISPVSPSDSSMFILADSLPSDVDFMFSEKQIPLLQQAVFNFLDNFDQASSPEFSPPLTPSCLPSTRDLSPSSSSQQSGAGSKNPSVNQLMSLDGRDAASTVHGPPMPSSLIRSVHQDIPLSGAAIDLAVDAFVGPEILKSARVILFLELVVGKVMEKLFTERMHIVLGYSRTVSYIHRLHEKLWGTDSDGITFNKEQARLSLEKATPKGIQLILGATNVQRSTGLLVESLQVQKLNKCLVYRLIDVFVDLLMYQDHCDQVSEEEL